MASVFGTREADIMLTMLTALSGLVYILMKVAQLCYGQGPSLGIHINLVKCELFCHYGNSGYPHSKVQHRSAVYIIVLFIPLLSAIISGLFGRKIGAKGAGILTSSCISISAILSCCIFYETTFNSSAAYIKL